MLTYKIFLTFPVVAIFNIADSYHIGSKHSEKIYVSRFIVCVCVGGGGGGGACVFVCLPGPRPNTHNNMKLANTCSSEMTYAYILEHLMILQLLEISVVKKRSSG